MSETEPAARWRCSERCFGTRLDTRLGICADMCVGMRLDTCADMCADMCIVSMRLDMRLEWCLDVRFRNAFEDLFAHASVQMSTHIP